MGTQSRRDRESDLEREEGTESGTKSSMERERESRGELGSAVWWCCDDCVDGGAPNWSCCGFCELIAGELEEKLL
jgi:hypothetical protein